MLRSKRETFDIGSWVEICYGKYKGDFGIVEDRDFDNRIIYITIHPHLDQSPNTVHGFRPSQCLASVDWLKKVFLSEKVHTRTDGMYRFQRGIYKDGF